ncbi:hypothetical protein B0H16DRAFT_1683920 [Mycena metata]|uniref:Apple domain-containing protein n=1 Tax=Mycena metata TaxID=1033252 RepID=A0AAD7K514_9AGAR|nr:hypothetical protein B0H16DRAFT_1683920 [Mycena metata]
MTRRLLAALCFLSCILLVAPANDRGTAGRRSPVNREDQRDDGYDQQGGYAQGHGGYENHPTNNNTQAGNDTTPLERTISKRHEKRDGYDDGYGYGYNNGGYSGGSYGSGYNSGGHTGENHHGSGHDNETALQVLNNRKGTEFCSHYLAQNNAGTVTVTSTEQTTVTTTSAVATITNTFTTTSTETDSTTTTTSTTYLPGLQQKRRHDPNQGLDRRLVHAAAAQYKRMQAQKRDMLPHWLHRFNDTEVASACGELVTPETTTATLTLTSTTFSLVTETDLSTTLTATTTSTTAYAVVTECPQSTNFGTVTSDSAGAFYNSGAQPDVDSCCGVCLNTTGCGFYYLDSSFNGCFISLASGPAESVKMQCPNGVSGYNYVTSSNENRGHYANVPEKAFSGVGFEISPSLSRVNGAQIDCEIGWKIMAGEQDVQLYSAIPRG